MDHFSNSHEILNRLSLQRRLSIAGGFLGGRGLGGFGGGGFGGGGRDGGGAGGEFPDAAVDEADVVTFVYLALVAVFVVDTAVGMDRSLVGKGDIARYGGSGAVHDLGELAVFFHDVDAAVTLGGSGVYRAEDHDDRCGEEEG